MNATPGKVHSLFQEQLRSYIRKHHENEYQLVDVREPEEYEAGHIGGAILLPLSALDVRIAELAKLEDKNLIFYCRSGTRSLRAATYAAQIVGFPKVFNLIGGIMAWEGKTIVGPPMLRAFQVTGDLHSVLMQALDLEKGAHRLYEELAKHFKGTTAQDVIEELARAEVAHARVLYDLLVDQVGPVEQDMQTLFDELPGELIESGDSYENVVQLAKQHGDQGSLALLELALEIELRAHDLYRALANQAPTEASRALLNDLAQHEKRHADGLFRKLEHSSRRELSA